MSKQTLPPMAADSWNLSRPRYKWDGDSLGAPTMATKAEVKRYNAARKARNAKSRIRLPRWFGKRFVPDMT